MSLRNVTLLAIIGICYLFVSRTVGTLVPRLFVNLTAAQFNVVLSFLASLAAVAFFAYFYKDYVQEGKGRLRVASVLATIGASGTSLLHAKGLSILFDPHAFPWLTRAHFIEPMIHWASSILILVFFISLHQETRHQEETKLRGPALFAVIGSSITLLVRTFVLVNYLCFREVRWFSDLAPELIVVFMPIIVFSFFASLYFFISFYRAQTETD